MIKLIVVSLAITSLAASARAQIAPFGGPVPIIVNPYPFNAPPPDAGADANSANAQRCAPVYGGRGGTRYPCANDNPR